MRELLGKRLALNLLAAIMIIGGMVFALGFGFSLHIAQNQVNAEVAHKVGSEISRAQTFIDLEMLRVEDAAYSLASWKFGNTVRDENGYAHIVIDESNFRIPSKEEVYAMQRQFLEANPHICGIAVGFAPDLYPHSDDTYGFAPYVTRTSDNQLIQSDVAESRNYSEWEWYAIPVSTDSSHWCDPFREVLEKRLISCFCVPLHGYNDRIVGVMAIDIDLSSFTQKCESIAPYPGAYVTLTDQDGDYIVEPDDTTRQGNEYIFSAPISRAGWTLKITCPKDKVLDGIRQMKIIMSCIAVVCLIILAAMLLYIFRRMQGVMLDKANIQSELNVAASIQMGMLPKLYPPFPNQKEIDIYGMLQPAKEVGGDLFDYFVRDEKLFLCIGDVSGKGVPASLYMAVLRSLFRNVSLHSNSPSVIVKALNQSLSQGNDQNMFCTMFVGILDLNNGELRFCNAGHNVPVIKRTDNEGVDIRFMKVKTNIAIGIIDDFDFEEEKTTMKAGDIILLYTDGVTEAENPDRMLYGEDRLIKVMEEAHNKSTNTAYDFIQTIYRDVSLHTRGCPQSDDVTMVILEYKKDLQSDSDKIGIFGPKI